jgi:[acyl-carrier-protein] S-malonyltransferase
MKIAFVFPGQGSQAVGMGMDVARQYETARKIYDKAGEILGFSLSDLIENGPAEELTRTVNTQPAVVTTSIALMEVLKEQGFECVMTAGHSVGEFAALYCAGVLSLENCIDLTRARGSYMNEAGEKYPGTMSAIMGLELPQLEEVCQKASEKGVVVIANLNNPGQIVISGSIEGVREAERIALESGAKKVFPLSVSAAFHSPLMDEAAEKLSEKIETVKFSDAKIPVVSNVSAEPVMDGEQMRQLMKTQISSRVYWEKIIRRMMDEGIEAFIEIGPGTALAGMIKKIDRKAEVYNFSDISSLQKLLAKFDKIPA